MPYGCKGSGYMGDAILSYEEFGECSLKWFFRASVVEFEAEGSQINRSLTSLHISSEFTISFKFVMRFNLF